jgi:hypothetical protein
MDRAKMLAQMGLDMNALTDQQKLNAQKIDLTKIRPENAREVLGKIGIDPDLFLKSMSKMMAKPREKKIPPNEKCPCGSDKKYKKCCFAKVAGKEARTIEEVAREALTSQ